MSFKSETPFIKDPNIKGIAMSLRAFINIVPKGLIQSEIKLDPKDVFDIIKPNNTNKTNPKYICQWIYIFIFIFL